MCGIVGYYSKTVNSSEFKSALKCIAHRGPDDEGIFAVKDNFLFGHRRLAIIDLSPKGHQPMHSNDGNYTIIYNGEVYNFKEEREILIAKGYTFNSHTDTEVILNQYIEYGIDFLNRLRGMFGLAIYDKKQNKVVVARDRMGIKPIYYYHDQHTFAFASELKSLKEFKAVNTEKNPQAISAFLQLGSLPFPLTLNKHIHYLEPGFYLEWKGNNELKKSQYFNIEVNKRQGLVYADEVKKLRSLLQEAVSIRTMSDVPFGAFLSGGIDSSVVVALMKLSGVEDLKTFSISFDDKKYSESYFAELVAKKFKTHHHTFIVQPSDVKKEFHNIVSLMDSPTVDGINTYFVSKFTREAGIIMAMSGLGGDELFGGYDTFERLPKLVSAKRKTRVVPNLILNQSASLLKKDKYKKLAQHLTSSSNDYASAYLALRGLLTAKTAADIMTVDATFNCAEYLEKLLSEFDYKDEADITSYFEARVYMHNQLLRDTDIMSMAHSLEARVPLIDQKLVEFAYSLPPEYRKGKRMLIDAMVNELPQEVYNRPKQGFLFPFPVWMKKEIKSEVQDLIFMKNDYLKATAVEKLWKGFMSDKVHWSRVWQIAVLNKKLS
ncbi:MAG: asparagine synthase (glutamine-hydrolyzing) [Bacteroidetes bacterium]|nr:asparagine synthase (glutamine-hydrolyzing) [Bacteroidota bacterium]